MNTEEVFTYYCKAMDAKKHRARRHCIPDDMVEIILSHLPVKSLLRFRGVCKQWSATISDPRFKETHLQLSNTCSSYLIDCETEGAVRRIDLANDEISTIEYCPSLPNHAVQFREVMSYCDGLFLMWHNYFFPLILWNLSTRKHRKVHCPSKIDRLCSNSGICYDPLIKDYKVVITDEKHYAVFYCKTNSWGELREMNNVKINGNWVRGVPFKGSIYWISSSRINGVAYSYRYEIVCFDVRDEKWKKNFHILDCTNDQAMLTSSRDFLYFIPKVDWSVPRFGEMVIMKKIGNDDPWMELKLNLNPFSIHRVLPICSTQDNTIILYTNEGPQYLLCDAANTKRGATRIQNTASVNPRYKFPYL